MNVTRRKSVATLAAALFIPLSAQGLANPTLEQWQLAVLFHPSTKQLERERAGEIMIYEGLRDIDVERALDQNFDRIEAMMFTRIVITDDEGVPLLNPKTGEVVVEDDGC